LNGRNALLQKKTFYGAHQKMNKDRPILSGRYQWQNVGR